MQIPSAFPHEPCFLDFRSTSVLSSDSPDVPHPSLIKAPETGHDSPAESSPALICNKGKRICQHSCLFSCDDRRVFFVFITQQYVPYFLRCAILSQGKERSQTLPFVSSRQRSSVVSFPSRTRVRLRIIEDSNIGDQTSSRELPFFAKSYERKQMKKTPSQTHNQDTLIHQGHLLRDRETEKTWYDTRYTRGFWKTASRTVSIMKDPPQPWNFRVMEGQKIKDIFMTLNQNENVDSKPQLRGSF